MLESSPVVFLVSSDVIPSLAYLHMSDTHVTSLLKILVTGLMYIANLYAEPVITSSISMWSYNIESDMCLIRLYGYYFVKWCITSGYS